MSERLLIPLPDGRWLALEPAIFSEALTHGQALMAPFSASRENRVAADETRELLDAEEIARLFHLKPSWFLERARLNEIPFVQLGKYVRFDPRVMREHLARGPDTRTIDPRVSRKRLNGGEK